MIKLNPSATFWQPVKVEMLNEDGKRVEYQFDAQFVRYSRSDFASIIDRVQNSTLSDDELAREILRGWRGVKDADGDELAFNEHNREALIDMWPVLPALIAAFMAANSPKRA